MKVSRSVTVRAIRMAGCGHISYIEKSHEDERRNDKKHFYCAVCGNSNYFPGKTAEDELREELADAHRLADQHLEEAWEQRQRADQISRSYNRVRERIKNGVCPCCNRTFENLARHMQTKHPEFADNKQLRTLRLAYGLTQSQLAEEVGVSPSYVSLYERGMELPASGEARLADWIREQCA